MGVPGLWDILRPAGKQQSLAQLAVHDGFERNPGGRRGLRVGIDASIWFYHATYGREGENPELRTLFFRCARLMSRPFLPLFVFDGPHRPEYKRKKKVGGKDHWMVSGMQEIIEAFGFEWWCAPGEAEAELAYLNRMGVIDAIITDDVDTFLFGATTIIRNPGKLLSGNNAHPVRNSANKDDGEHTYTYSSSDISEHSEINLTQDGMILIALLRGGDYDPDGVDGCGAIVAHALARCGFGARLADAARNLPRARLEAFMDSWRNEVRAELRTNSRGFLNTKKVKLANDLPDTFPNINVLQLYVHPVTSERKNVRPVFLWDREPDLMKLAALCERKFEWGVREIIIKRFRTVMWAPVVLRIMRRAVLDTDAVGPSTPKKRRPTRKDTPPGTPSKMITERFSSLSAKDENDSQRLIVGIHGKREHASTDGLPEYRLEISPAQLVRLTEAGVQGHRIPPSQYRNYSDDDYVDDMDDEDDEGKATKGKKAGPKKPPPEPTSHLRVWMPACIVERVEPRMVADYEGRIAQKERDKEAKAARKAARAAGIESPKSKPRSKAGGSGAMRRKPAKRTEYEEEEEEELSADEDFSHVFGLSSKAKGKAKVTGTSKSTSRARLKPVSSGREEEEEEEEEEEDVISHSPLRGNGKSKPAPFTEATNSSPERRPRTNPFPSPSRSNALPKRSLTHLQRQKTILDLLDERRQTQRVVPSAESVSSPVKPNSQIARPATLRPFPMSQEDKEDWFGEITQKPKCTTSAAGKPHSQNSTARKDKMDSGDICISTVASPKKSPRKSKGHGSPSSRQPSCEKAQSVLAADLRRNAITITDSEDESPGYESDAGGRPTSPSPPTRPKVTTSTKTASVGNFPGISMQERQKVSSSAILSSLSIAPTKSASSISRPKSTQAEIIEISSSSESDDGKPTGAVKGVPKATSRATSNKRAQIRVDSIFRVTKPVPPATQKSLSQKKGKKQPPAHLFDEVIEIL